MRRRCLSHATTLAHATALTAFFALMLDDRQDYFGLSVNIASRVQELADPTAILATKPIVNAAEAAGLVGASGYRTSSRRLSLRGVSEAFTIYEIREREPAAAAA